MIDFLLKSSASLLVFLTFYHLILETEKMHRFNRFYLLATLVISFVIPFLSFEIIQVIPSQVVENIPMVSNFASPKSTQVEESTNHLPIILGAFYGVVTLILGFKFAKNIFKIFQKAKCNPNVKFKNATLILIEENALPHSFLNYIFVNFSAYQNQQIEDELFTHELVHVTQKHTIDIFFIEIFRTLLWFHPLVYFYKKAIQLNHEFLADEKVVHSYNNITYYQNLLLQKSSKVETIYLASNLNFLITKKRLIMMTKSTSNQMAFFKKAAVVPIFTGLIYLFCIDVVAQEQTATKSEFPDKELNEYYGNTRVIIKDKEGKIVADKKYPELSQEQKMKIPPPPPAPKQIKLSESQFSEFKNNSKYAVWIDNNYIKSQDLDKYKASQFVYFTNSNVYKNARSAKFPQANQVNLYTENGYKDTFLTKDKKLGGTIEIRENEVNNLDLNKEDGYINFENNTYYTILVDGKREFYNRWGVLIVDKMLIEKLSKIEVIKDVNQLKQTKDENYAYNLSEVENKPDFPGGIYKFYKFVGDAYKPSQEMNTIKGGKVFVSFVIEKDGSLSNFEIIRDFGFGSGEEAIRVLKLSPNWIPGKMDGKLVRTQYSLPITINGGN